MKDYPDHFPKFMQDFHEQKRLFKAFFVWRLMMDAKCNADLAKRSNLVDFMCLFDSMLDFLFLHGYQLQRTRRKGSYANVDRSVESLNNLGNAWGWLLGAEPQPVHPAHHIGLSMKQWEDWIEYMPQAVQEKWKELSDIHE